VAAFGKPVLVTRESFGEGFERNCGALAARASRHDVLRYFEALPMGPISAKRR
jgi:hypothetical protein